MRPPIPQDSTAILAHVDEGEDAGEWVVQKYLERPFLILGRKFDIRTWVVLDPRGAVWLWNQVPGGRGVGPMARSAGTAAIAGLSTRMVHLRKVWRNKPS